MNGPEKGKWQVAMNGEMQSMKDNEVWEEVDLPPGAKCNTPNIGSNGSIHVAGV